MSTISERVQRGAELLDAGLPDWWQTHRFDLAKFDLKSGCSCVVGQLWPQAGGDPDHWDSAFDQAVNTAWLDLNWDTAVEYGFYAGSPFDGDHDAEYAELEREWRRVITERRAAA